MNTSNCSTWLFVYKNKAPHCPASRRDATQSPLLGVLGLVTKEKEGNVVLSWVIRCNRYRDCTWREGLKG